MDVDLGHWHKRLRHPQLTFPREVIGAPDSLTSVHHCTPRLPQSVPQILHASPLSIHFRFQISEIVDICNILSFDRDLFLYLCIYPLYETLFKVVLSPTNLPSSFSFIVLTWLWPQSFKRWIALSIEQISIQTIMQLVFLILTCWIVIYWVDSAIQLLNNRELMFSRGE